jgi:outer membrane protein
VGTRTVVDVLDAQNDRFQAQRDYQQAVYDYLLNTLRLKLAAGTLSPEDLRAVNRQLSTSQ